MIINALLVCLLIFLLIYIYKKKLLFVKQLDLLNADLLLKSNQIEALKSKVHSLEEGNKQSNKQNFITSGTLHDMGNVLNGLNFKIHGISRIAFTNKFKEIKRAVDLLKVDDLPTEKKERTFEFIELLIDEFAKDKEKSKKLSSDAQRLIKHMIEIIDLRQHRKTSASNNNFHDANTINEVIHSALLINEYLIQGNNISIQSDIHGLDNVNVNPSILLDVLANLIKNACEAIIAYSQSDKILKITAKIDGPSLIICVIDSGIGMDDKTIEKVFLGHFTTKDYGLGVGLVHSKSQIETLGGTLRAQSIGVGHGSIFTVTLPL